MGSNGQKNLCLNRMPVSHIPGEHHNTRPSAIGRFWKISIYENSIENDLLLLNIGYVSNETNTDVHMYIEEFILIDIITLLYNWILR